MAQLGRDLEQTAGVIDRLLHKLPLRFTLAPFTHMLLANICTKPLINTPQPL